MTLTLQSQQAVTNWKNSLVLGFLVKTLMPVSEVITERINIHCTTLNSYMLETTEKTRETPLASRETRNPLWTLSLFANSSSEWSHLAVFLSVPRVYMAQGHHSEFCYTHSAPEAWGWHKPEDLKSFIL